MNSKNKSFRPFLALLLTLAMVLGSVGGFGSGKAAKAAGEAKLTIQASKELKKGDAVQNMTAGQFSFKLEGNGVSETVTNKADGSITFSALSFSAPGTYEYTITELVPEGAVKNADGSYTKDGVNYQYDLTPRKVLVTVDANNKISSVTVDGTAVTTKDTGMAADSLGSDLTVGAGELNLVNLYTKLNTTTWEYEWVAEEGTPFYIDIQGSDNAAFCLDDYTQDPNGDSYTEFDPTAASDLAKPGILDTIKKLLYFGSPYDGGNGEIVNWIINNCSQPGVFTYDETSAQAMLKYVTILLLHDITNEAQGLLGQEVENAGGTVTVETRLLDYVINRSNGEFTDDFKPNIEAGLTSVHYEVAQKIWKKVADPNNNYVTDLVELRTYTAYSGNFERPGDELDRQRIITPVFASAYSVALNAPFSNSIVEKTEPEKVSVTVTKQWVGPKDSEVSVQLMADGKASGEPVTLNQGNNWKYTWTDLAKTKADGTEIEYKVDEPTVPTNYKKSVAHQGNNWTITNTNTETVEVKATKKWVDLDGTTAVNAPAGASVTLQLYAGEAKSGEAKVLDCSEKPEATATWSELPKYDAAGQEIQYSVKEVGFSADGFTKGEVSGNMKDGFEISNKKTAQETTPEKISVTVEKEWEGEALESVSVQLFADDEAYGDPIILNADNNWTHTWAELDKTQADGTPIEYTVEEAESDEYNLVGFSTADDKEGNLTYHLVNTKVAPEMVNVTVKKNWVGEPASEISFTLTRNGVAADTQTLTGEPWTYTWTDLPKVDEKGVAYAYFVEEAALEGYTMTGGGYTDDGEGHITITIKNTKDVKVKISKVDLVNGKAVSGADIELMNEAKEVIEAWTSGEGPKEFELAPGYYSFREVNAPEGYVRVESVINFKVNEEGQIILDSIEVTPADAVEVKGDTIFPKNELKQDTPETSGSTEAEEIPTSTSSEEGEETETTAPDESGSLPAGGGEEEEESSLNGESEQSETEETESEQEGTLPGGGAEEEESSINGESELSESETTETEPEGTLPFEEEEEGTSVAAETEIPEASTPKGTTTPSVPDTGDHNYLGLYLGLMSMAATAGIGLLIGTRKTKEEN